MKRRLASGSDVVSMFQFIPGKLYCSLSELHLYQVSEKRMVPLTPIIDYVMFLFKKRDDANKRIVSYKHFFLSPKFGVVRFNYWIDEPNEKFFSEGKV
jgi:hypothetical protein